MFIIFDTETTGLPLNWNAPITDLNNWPRVIQISWAVYDIEFNLVNEQTLLIKPDNWFIKDLPYWENLGFTKEQVLADKNKKFWTENGYTNEENEKHGKPMPEVLQMFINDLQNCVYMVAHNIDYDFNVLGAEFLRYGLKSNKKLLKICTMKSTTNFVKAPNSYRRNEYKWPTLTELHTKLFNKGFDGAHDAGADVKACASCLELLLKRRIILLPVLVDNSIKYFKYKDLKDEIELHELRTQNRTDNEENIINHENKDFENENN